MIRQACALVCVLGSISISLAAGEWPQFRGPTADGHSAAVGVPVTWGEKENVKWKTAIPGQGWSSPVVWDDQIWLTTALSGGKSLRAIAVHRETGAMLHDIELFTPANPGRIHQLNSFASPTPVLDGQRAYVHFGNFGTAAINRKDGSIAWTTTEFDDVKYSVGPGSSPILYGDLFIVHCDGTNGRFLLALNKDTGKIAWKKDRWNKMSKSPENEKSFNTPVLVKIDGKDQLISLHADAITGYDPLTGNEIWRHAYKGYSNVAVPVVGHGHVYVNTGYDYPEFFALKLGAVGTVPEENITWSIRRGIGARVSPLLVGDHLYLTTDDGIVQCVDAKTGEQVWRERIGGQFCASPIFVDGRIYFFDQTGTTTILAPGDTFKQIGQPKLGDGFMASPAIAGKALFLRSKSHLYRVEQ